MHTRTCVGKQNNTKNQPQTNVHSSQMGGAGRGRNPVTQGGHALLWLWFYGRHKPDGPQLVLLGQTASLPEVIPYDQQYS